ncbi:RecQ family ATP-dependent DNA helicase [Sediminitomix flava]|uniref:ATP-dependent DNA helicase RecQ n=1 Tax=Sediminitomix flava TaxID=379075 RepID=A0A315Z730_SEDFL|nr:ATP-dependent DNA helicase RecQ [Sediminitomix flava]PWJ40217.1 ATP-dependent DNA helicase RecQ [Sediminitomix flava]
MNAKIGQILKYYWGFDSFRPLQEDIITSVLEKQDTLALLPTGGGKSICFQVPALAIEGVCVVVTPLIALMKDQVQNLKAKKIPAEALYSGMPKRQIDLILDNCIYGKVKFLYVSPERLKTKLFLERAAQMNISLIAVDEAHCISQWGYDFRPPYLQIADFRKTIPDVPILALTASAGKLVQSDIKEKLLFGAKSKTFSNSFQRKNLSFSVREAEDKAVKLKEILSRVEGCAIVYLRNRQGTEDVANYLNHYGVSSDFYHAGLNNQERSLKQDKWMNNQTRVMVATNAFGMGIDKPDVRIIIHLDPSDSIEAYYQEAGRAGRDGEKSYAVLLNQTKDFDRIKQRIDKRYPEPKVLRRVYQILGNYFRLAAGGGEMATFDFVLEDFLKKYDLPHAETFYALKCLEEQGFILISEPIYQNSNFMFAVSQENVYKFQVANYAFDPLLKSLVRFYGGEAFTHYVNISEQTLANSIHVSVSQLREYLAELHSQGILVFQTQKDKAQLTYLTERYVADNLPIDVKILKERKARELEKIQAMMNYTQNTRRCRSVLISEYFDETTAKPCGVCDNCIKYLKKASQPLDLKKDIQSLLEKVKEADIQEIESKLRPTNKNYLIDLVREMVEEGELHLDEFGQISLANL